MKKLFSILFFSSITSSMAEDSLTVLSDPKDIKAVLVRADSGLKHRLLARALLEGQMPKVDKLEFQRSQMEVVKPDGNGFEVICHYSERAYQAGQVLEEINFRLRGACL